MRRNRLIAAGFAAAVTLGLLAVAQPGNANTETTTDNKITSESGVVIFAVQSRAPNIDDEDVDGNALAIFNSTLATVNLNGWTIRVQDGSGAVTAAHSFGDIDLLAKQHYILHTTDFVVNPLDGQAHIDPFSSQPGTDEIDQTYQVTLFNADGQTIPDDIEDLVASADTANITPEGNEPVPQLSAATDQFNAVVRRDVRGFDSDINRDDFLIMPAGWGTVL